MSVENVLHRLIDAAAGLANIGAHEADALHDEISPAYSAKPLTDAEQAQLEALQAKAATAYAVNAAAAAQATPQAPAV